MAGETPFRKRRPWRRHGPEENQDGNGGTGPERGIAAPERSAVLPDQSGGPDDERGRTASLEAAGAAASPGPAGELDRRDRAEPATGAGRLHMMKHGVRRGGEGAKALAAQLASQLADRVIETAPRVPVRDLATLREQFPGLGPEELADKLVAGACRATATVGAGIGAVAMMPVPPAMLTELAAEVTGVAAIEMKLVAELHEVYGRRPPGHIGRRSTAYLTAWTEERGIDVTRPTTLNAALGGQMKRELRQQLTKRMARNLPTLIPFMIGAAVGAEMNRRDTRKLADRVRKDLRRTQVPWDRLTGLPPLDQPARPAALPEAPESP